MKFSIKSVFNNILIFFLFLTLLLALLSLITFEQHITFKKLITLQKIHKLIDKMDNTDRTQIAYSKILLNGLDGQLNEELLKLNDIAKHDYISKIFGYDNIYLNQLNRLQELSTQYASSLQNYLNQNKKHLSQYLTKIIVIKNNIMDEIDVIQSNNTTYQYSIFIKLQWLVYFIFLLSLFILLRYKKKLRLIYEDIELLYGINSGNKKIPTLTKEADAIQLRMIRKPMTSDNPSMIDPATQIKNYKGMLYSYANKKGVKEKNFTIVCLFEIDNFNNYSNLPKDFLQTVLKKIAFIMSLYEHTTDVIARADYNQFVVVLSRDSTHKAFDECEAIRQSVEEIVFKPSKTQKIHFTLSGGFILKPRNKTLEEIINQAAELLQTAQKKGGNIIIQIKDHAELFD